MTRGNRVGRSPQQHAAIAAVSIVTGQACVFDDRGVALQFHGFFVAGETDLRLRHCQAHGCHVALGFREVADGAGRRHDGMHGFPRALVRVTGRTVGVPRKNARVLHCGRRQGRSHPKDEDPEYELAARDHWSSPLESKRSPATAVPDARNSRILPRFAPETLVAWANTCTASDKAVPSGSRKIQGMFVEVSILSEEIASTGTKDFHADLFG